MTKREKVDIFIDYGADALLSQLIGDGGTDRGEAVLRLTELLKNYADRCRFIGGRAAAYRYMIKKARARGWLGRGYQNIKSCHLTEDEREEIRAAVSGYISTGGRKAKYIKAALIVIAATAVLAVLSYAAIVWFERTIESVKL